MSIDPGIVCVLLTAVVALQGWQLREMINMKIRIATMQARLRLTQLAKKQPPENGGEGDTDFIFR